MFNMPHYYISNYNAYIMVRNTFVLFVLLYVVGLVTSLLTLLSFVRSYIILPILILVVFYYICKESFWNNLLGGYYNKNIYKYANFIIILDVLIQPFDLELRSIIFVLMLAFRLVSKKLMSVDVNFIWDYGWIGAIIVKYLLNNNNGKLKRLVIWHVLAYKQFIVLDDGLRRFLDDYYNLKKV